MIAEGTSRASAIAHPNIALAKYWGKRDGEGNVPAVPSLSVTLQGLATRTTVSFESNLVRDELCLDGVPASTARITGLLDRVRTAAGITTFARVRSLNDFPTASGLASSASGFAALAVAATTAAGLTWRPTRISNLARRASASAARSIFGGFVHLDATADGARPIAGPEHLDLAVLVCVTTESKKSVSSTLGMLETQRRSPYYAAWREDATKTCAAIEHALVDRDFDALGELSEHSALSMHACAMAAGIVYLNGASLALLGAVRELRKNGLGVYATMDAGPHVKVLVRTRDAGVATKALAPLARRIIEATPGEGARALEEVSP